MKRLLILISMIFLLAAGSATFLFAFSVYGRQNGTGEEAALRMTDTGEQPDGQESAGGSAEQTEADAARGGKQSATGGISTGLHVDGSESAERTEGDTGRGAEQNAPGESLRTGLNAGEREQENDAFLTEYAYSQLSDRERQIYREILRGLRSFSEKAPVSTEEETEFEKIFTCVMNDHPEIFYVDGYTFIRYERGGVSEGSAFSGSYLYDEQETARRTAAIESKAQNILAGAPDGSDYEKIKYVYEYLVTHTEYRLGAADNQNLCSVFLNGKSVCQGYAKAAQYLLGRLGIECIFVTGTVETGEAHAWNVVRSDGAYYHVDTTWGDASYVIEGTAEEYEGRKPEINYEYLCVPDEQLFQTHTIENVVPVPVCGSMKDNYYVREGAYFVYADMEKAKKLFDAAYGGEHEYVTLKCAEDTVYEEMKRRLITEQEVFQYMHCDGMVAYVCNQKQRTLSFWL